MLCGLLLDRRGDRDLVWFGLVWQSRAEQCSDGLAGWTGLDWIGFAAEVGAGDWAETLDRSGLRERRLGLALRPTESRRWGMTNGPEPGGREGRCSG